MAEEDIQTAKHCNDAVWQDLEDESSRVAHERSRTAKAHRNDTNRSCRVRLSLNEEDTEKVRKDLYCQMQAVVDDKIFIKLLPILMNMKEHTYRQEDEPEDEELWDQKCWSRLCRITASGIHEDAGNKLYSILIAVLVQCAANIPEEWRIAKFAGQSKHITGDAEALSDHAIERVGDV